MEELEFIKIVSGLRAKSFRPFGKNVAADLSELHSAYPREHFERIFHSKISPLTQPELTNHGRKSRFWGNDFPFVICFHGK